MFAPSGEEDTLYEAHEARWNLKVLIVRVNGTKPGNLYATCTIGGRPHTGIKTDMKLDPVDPVWMFMGELNGYIMGESLELKVFNSPSAGGTKKVNAAKSPTADDSTGSSRFTRRLTRVGSSIMGSGDEAVPDELVGRCTMEWTSFHPEGFDDRLVLQETGDVDGPVTLEVKVLVVPVVPPPEDAKRLFVKILSASGLPTVEGNAYVRAQLRGKEGKMVTRIGGYQQSEPMFNEEDELHGYQEGDELELIVMDFIDSTQENELGSTSLGHFHPYGFEGELPIRSVAPNAKLDVIVEVYEPPPNDPGEHVTIQDRQPVPFQLRSLETNRVHRLCAYTQVGRSRRDLDPSLDLILDTPGIEDVSRVHAVVKAWQGPDISKWFVRAYSLTELDGNGLAEGGGHAGGGTSVDGVPVERYCGSPVEPSGVLRFGMRELWALERVAVLHRSQKAQAAGTQARQKAEEDPESVRRVPISTLAVYSALRKCTDWPSLVRVCLESIGEQDEPPCADAISVTDECGALICKHVAETVEEQEAYDVQEEVIKDINLGASLQLHLSSDPCLLAPLLQRLEQQRHRLAEEKDRELDDLQL